MWSLELQQPFCDLEGKKPKRITGDTGPESPSVVPYFQASW